MARRATAIAQAREKHQNVLLLDAGDSLANDQDPARATEGRTSVDAMNRMGYDAVALGALDIALGPDALRARAAEALYPFLSANVYDRNTGERIALPFLAKEIAGRKVYLIGVTQEASTDAIEVRDPIAEVRSVLQDIPAGKGIVILLSNAGEEMDARLAQDIPEIDAIIAGGGGPVRNPVIEKGLAPRFHADLVAPGHAGRNIGLGVLAFDPDGRLAVRSWSRIPLGPEIPADPAMLEWVSQAKSGQ